MIDYQLLSVMIIALSALAIGIVLHFLKQPSVVAYILTGVVISASGFLGDKQGLQSLGNIGVVLLLFFVGMELDISKILSRWRISFFGVLLQIIVSFVLVSLLGIVVGGSLYNIVFITFVITLSSTAVVIKILEREKLMDSEIGNDIVGILIVQDLAVIPMLLVLSFLKGGINIQETILEIIGAVIIGIFIFWLLKRKTVHLPFRRIKQDHELQVLTALVIVFGFSLLTSFFNLSAGLGAFLAGLLVSRAQETEWVKQSLESFRVIFVALFFISVGVLINIQFVMTNILPIIGIVFVVFFANTIVNAVTFRWLRQDWCYCWYAGSMLAQIGEFSFLLTALALQNNSISTYFYDLTIAIIAISLLLSPFWIKLFSRLVTDKVCKVPVHQKYGKKS